jgi:hypothetical protein
MTTLVCQTYPCHQTKRFSISSFAQRPETGRSSSSKLAENFGEFERIFQRDFVLKNSCLFGVSVLHCVGHFFVALLQPA